MSARDIILSGGGGVVPSGPPYVEDVFSTYSYTGTGSTQTINNGIDLAGNGGLVWTKARTSTIGATHLLGSPQQTNILQTSSTGFDWTPVAGIYSSFNSNGYRLTDNNHCSAANSTFVSWTFRKAPKFFDIVTWTGNGANIRYISHSLTGTAGCVIAKRTDSSGNWIVGHRSYTAGGENLLLNSSSAISGNYGTIHNLDAYSGTAFGVYNGFGSTDPANYLNVNGATYIAYIFAHDAGGFGLTGTDNVISCGSYVGDGTSNKSKKITLGYEPQFIIAKAAQAGPNGFNHWSMFDIMRGITTDGNDPTLAANHSGEEDTGNDMYSVEADGFRHTYSNSAGNDNGITYIYIAIRRPMKTPTVGTQVYYGQYAVEPMNSPFVFNSPFPPDLLLTRFRDTEAQSHYAVDRLRGHSMALGTANNGATMDLRVYPYIKFDGTGGVAYIPTSGYGNNSGGSGTNTLAHAFKRAPGFFDIVCYTGTGVAARTVAHNLGVVPELAIFKNRTNVGWNWVVKTTATFGTNSYLILEGVSSLYTHANYGATATSSQLTLSTGSNAGDWNQSGAGIVAYLFASCPGVSKVGSYTGNGSSQNIACGFAAGARFILIKRTDSSGDWYVWNSTRGIISANDPHLSLNTTAVEVTTDDSVDPDNSGFIVNQVSATNINVTSATYIFLAIA